MGLLRVGDLRLVRHLATRPSRQILSSQDLATLEVKVVYLDCNMCLYTFTHTDISFCIYLQHHLAGDEDVSGMRATMFKVTSNS